MVSEKAYPTHFLMDSYENIRQFVGNVVHYNSIKIIFESDPD